MTWDRRFDFGDGRVYLMRPLKGHELIKLVTRLAGAQRDPDTLAGAMAALNAVIDAVHASLQQGNPTLSRDDVADLVDTGNLGDVVAALTGSNSRKPTRVQMSARGIH